LGLREREGERNEGEMTFALVSIPLFGWRTDGWERGKELARVRRREKTSTLDTSPFPISVVNNADFSPKINPDLLQRSEVVALFNTLHRTSESLAAVEQFRQMYKETQDAEAAAAKTRAEQKLKPKKKRKVSTRLTQLTPVCQSAHISNRNFSLRFGSIAAEL
jgi:hypothetical protein